MEDPNINNSQMNHGKPSRNLSVMRQCTSSAFLADSEFDVVTFGFKSPSDEKSRFLPMFRSGCCYEKGPKQYMEDEYICVDNLSQHLGAATSFPSLSAFYGVLDGHEGIDAASFTRNNILRFIIENSQFPCGLKKAVKNAFVKADHALADSKSLNTSSCTTTLTTIILGRTMLIANARDCRAVLGKRGRAIELSKDHKPNRTSKRLKTKVFMYHNNKKE